MSETSSRRAIAHPPRKLRSQLAVFMKHCESVLGERYPTYAHFHEFSAADYRSFWRLFLRWSKLAVAGDDDVVSTSDVLHETEFFPHLTLNYARALVSGSPLADDEPALIARRWTGITERLTRGQLKARVMAGATALAKLGLGRHSRAVMLGFSDANSVAAVLSAAAVGTATVMADPDMTADAAIARLRAVEPQVIFCHARAPYEQTSGTHQKKLIRIIQAIPSLTAVVLLDSAEPLEGIALPCHAFSDMVLTPADASFEWPALPFNHPLYILFSSGTTGNPKALVHGAGGTLLEQVKEHRLHCDLQPGDRMFFHSSTAWMMWSWALAALASGTAIVVYDGAVLTPETLWRLVSEERVTVFGTSPAYLQMSESIAGDCLAKLDFSHLRAVLSTGSILYPQQQRWFNRHIKPIPIQSISGGTDIIGCFVMGNPDLPAFPGEPQCKGLGFDLRALPVEGATRAGVGELVCANPFPSRPVGLVGDPDRTRFFQAYFAQHRGYWTQGDLVEFTKDGSIVMHGRSDGILNIRGIRIGPADIYQALKNFTEIDEAMAVEQRVPSEIGHARIVLLIVLKPQYRLTAELERRITRTIANRTSAAHVPAVIAQVDELPTTYTGKRSERSARDAVNAAPASNNGALRNPHCLAAIASHPALRIPHHPMAPAGRTALGAPRVPSEQWLTALWETTLNIRPIDRDDDFFDVGGNSITALQLLKAVQDHSGKPMPLTVMYEARTIARMSRFFSEARARPASDLVLIKAGAGGDPLFMVHGLGGDIMELFPVGRLIVHPGPVYAIRARGLDGETSPLRSVQEMAAAYLRAIRLLQPKGPYHLSGYSFGGLIAYEMSLMLAGQAEDVAMLTLIDTSVDERYWPLSTWLKAMATIVRKNVKSAYQMPAAARLSHLQERLRGLQRRMRLRSTTLAGSAQKIDADLPAEIRAVREAAVLAMSMYKPRSQAKSMLFIRAAERDPLQYDALPLWKSLVKDLRLQHVPCDHLSLMRPPYAERVANILSQELYGAGLRSDERFSGYAAIGAEMLG